MSISTLIMKRILILSFALFWSGLATAKAQRVTITPKPKPQVEIDIEDTPAPKQEPKPKAKPAKAAKPAKRAQRAPEPPEPPESAAAIADEEEVSRQTVTAVNNVVIRLELNGGDIQVYGWDKPQVQAEAVSGGRVMLERTDESAENKPAAKLEVYIKRRTARELAHVHDDFNCSQDIADHVILNVPKGATVYLKTANGDVIAENVAEVNAESSNGDVRLENIQGYVNGFAANGDVSATNLAGRISVKSLSGDVGVYRAQPIGAGDYLKATAISGDVLLDKVAHANVEASTVSGEVLYQGLLARGGNYVFRTTSGDITAIIPADSSFKLSARSPYGDISTDFALRSEANASPEVLKNGKLVGTSGKGESTLTMTSFSGMIVLRKK